MILSNRLIINQSNDFSFFFIFFTNMILFGKLFNKKRNFSIIEKSNKNRVRKNEISIWQQLSCQYLQKPTITQWLYMTCSPNQWIQWPYLIIKKILFFFMRKTYFYSLYSLYFCLLRINSKYMADHISLDLFFITLLQKWFNPCTMPRNIVILHTCNQ